MTAAGKHKYLSATCFSYVPFDVVGVLQRALKVDKPEEAAPEFAEL